MTAEHRLPTELVDCGLDAKPPHDDGLELKTAHQENESFAVEDGIGFREYRAPRRHGTTFWQPGFAAAAGLISDNQAILKKHGSFWQSLRQRARGQVIQDAKRYTSTYRDISWVGDDPDPAIIMAGHQPTLFHPGVWFKNFALSRLGQANRALAINFIVDNDVAAGSSIRVPSINPATGFAVYRNVAYDQAGGGVPFEQSTIRDRAVFDRFDQEVTEAMRPLVADPCVGRLWEHARSAVDRCGVAGCALAQARHGLEGEIGLQTLEVPLAVICRGEAFSEFVTAILSQLPRFHHCYNESTHLYRRAHGIRSSAHPVPDLAEQDGWLEAPLWIYGNQSPTRRAAWVKLSGDQLLISDRTEREIRISAADIPVAAEQLSQQLGPEFKLRPRALVTTMYARTVLSDLFLHGIGGAKYDQLGDMITQSFFGIIPLRFMVISATVLLPGIEHTEHVQQITALKRQIRDTQFQPERYADQLSGQVDLLRRKDELLQAIPPRGSRIPWSQEMANINRQLAHTLQPVRESLAAELAEAKKQAASQSILASREHPFCAFPLDHLRETFERLLET